MKLRKVPRWQAIEVSLQVFAEVGVGNGLVVAGFNEAVVDVVMDVVVAAAAEGARRRGTLSNAFHQIHSRAHGVDCGVSGKIKKKGSVCVILRGDGG